MNRVKLREHFGFCKYSGNIQVILLLILVSASVNCNGVRRDSNNNYLNLAEETSCGDGKVNYFKKSSKILGGHEAELGEFPFLASIRNADGVHFCSALIIKKQILLTAAHCFIGTLYGSVAYKDYKVIVGTNNWTDSSSSTSFNIARVLMHPEYSYLKPNVENDLAILELDRPLDWNKRIKPVCLATPKFKIQRFGVVAGWGVHSEKQNLQEWKQDTSLRKVSLPIWNNDACQLEYKKQGINWHTRPTHICAGYQGIKKDTCQGDSGSGLVQEMNGRKIAFGIVSVGEGCASGLPGLYTRVANYLEWIQNNS